MKQPKPSTGGVFLGGPTILTVLLTLCLCCFALLTWFQARTDYGYAVRSAQTVTDFYEADRTVDTLLSETASLLKQAAISDAGAELERAMTGENSTAVYDFDTQTVTLTVPAGIQGDLQVVFQLHERDGGTGLAILSRRVLAQNVEESEQHLNVFQNFAF